MSTFYLGQKFNSFYEFENFLQEYENSNYVKFYKRDSTKIESIRHRIKHYISPDLVYYDVKYACIRGGPLQVKGTGKRRSSTFKMDCPAHISLRSTLCGKYLEIKRMNDSHNHEISKLLFDHLPQQRKLPDDIREKTKELLSLNVDKRLLQRKILKETGKIVTIKDLSNLTKGIKRRTSEFCDAVSSLLQVEFGTDDDLSELLKKKDKNKKLSSINELSTTDLGKSTIIHLQPYVENEIECDSSENQINIKTENVSPPPSPPPPQSPTSVTYLLTSEVVTPESSLSASVSQPESNSIDIQGCLNCSHLEARLDSIDKKLETIKQLIEGNTVLLQKALHSGCEYSATVQLEPAQTYEELASFNEKLTDKDEFFLLVGRLGLQAGKDVAEVTRRILSVLISDKLALKLGWKGGPGKRTIQDFPNVLQLVKASVRRSIHSENIPDNTVEEEIKYWIRCACYRVFGVTNSPEKSDIEEVQINEVTIA